MPDDDKTSVGHGPADDTEVVAPATESENSDGLAWSLADAQDYQTPGQWRDRLLWGGLVLLLCAVTAVTVLFATVFLRGHQSGPTAAPAKPAPTAMPSAQVSALPAPPATVASPPTTVIVQAPPQASVAAPPAPSASSGPIITSQQAKTICRWLRDPAWTMPQIESSTGDMLANDNPSFTESDVFKAIGAAMTSTCPDAHRSF